MINKNSGMNKIKLLFCILVVSGVFTSCLDDKKFLDIANTGAIVEFPRGSADNLNVFSVLPGTPVTDTAIAINIASPQMLDRDVTVTLRQNVTVITDYNTVHGTAFETLPDTLYTVESYKVTIPKGFRIGRLKMRINFPKFDLSKSYAIAFQIAEVSPAGITISGNYNTFIWTLGVRNQWDGIYRVKGTGTHPTAAFSGPFSYQNCDAFTLETSGPNSVDLKPGQPFSNAGTLNIFGVFPRFNIAANNIVTVSPGPGNAVTFFTPAGGYPSRYVPATRTFYVQVGWTPAAPRVFIDTLVYCGER